MEGGDFTANVFAKFGEWEVVLVIIALVSFVKIFMNATKCWTEAITKLDVTVEQLTRCVYKFKESNKETHGKIFKQLDDHGVALNEHDKRISILEEKR